MSALPSSVPDLSGKMHLQNPHERIVRMGGIKFVQGELPADKSGAYALIADGGANTVLYMPCNIHTLRTIRDTVTRIVARLEGSDTTEGNND